MIEAQDRAYHESLMADQEKVRTSGLPRGLGWGGSHGYHPWQERQRLMEEEQRQELERAEELEKQEREVARGEEGGGGGRGEGYWFHMLAVLRRPVGLKQPCSQALLGTRLGVQ